MYGDSPSCMDLSIEVCMLTLFLRNIQALLNAFADVIKVSKALLEDGTNRSNLRCCSFLNTLKLSQSEIRRATFEKNAPGVGYRNVWMPHVLPYAVNCLCGTLTAMYLPEDYGSLVARE